MPSHLASYDGFMGHSSWWSYWDRHGWLQSMLDSAPPASPMPDPPSPAPVEAPDDTTPLQPSATPSHSTSPVVQDPLGWSSSPTAPSPWPSQPASTSLPADSSTTAPSPLLSSPASTALPADPSAALPPPGLDRLGPFKVARVYRIECREPCSECTSGWCGAVLDDSKPETMMHKHRCRTCYRAFRAKQHQLQ